MLHINGREIEIYENLNSLTNSVSGESILCRIEVISLKDTDYFSVAALYIGDISSQGCPSSVTPFPPAEMP